MFLGISNDYYNMVQINRMSFFSHLPNCVCKKCGKERDRFLNGKKCQGKPLSDDVNVEEFNNMIVERYDLSDGKIHFRGKFTA